MMTKNRKRMAKKYHEIKLVGKTLYGSDGLPIELNQTFVSIGIAYEGDEEVQDGYLFKLVERNGSIWVDGVTYKDEETIDDFLKNKQHKYVTSDLLMQ